MPTVASLNVALSAASPAFAGQMQSHGQEVKKFSKESKNALEDLKESFGRRSTLNESLEALRGMGVVKGLSEAGKMMKEFADKAKDLATEFREGKKGAGDIAEELAAGLPIIGQFWQAGRAIKDLMDGESARLKEMVELEKLETEAVNEQAKAKKEIAAVQAEIAKRVRETGEERQIAEAGAGGEALRQKFADQKKLGDTNDFFKGRKEAIKKSYQDEINALQAANAKSAEIVEKGEQAKAYQAEHATALGFKNIGTLGGSLKDNKADQAAGNAEAVNMENRNNRIKQLKEQQARDEYKVDQERLKALTNVQVTGAIEERAKLQEEWKKQQEERNKAAKDALQSRIEELSEAQRLVQQQINADSPKTLSVIESRFGGGPRAGTGRIENPLIKVNNDMLAELKRLNQQKINVVQFTK